MTDIETRLNALENKADKLQLKIFVERKFHSNEMSKAAAIDLAKTELITEFAQLIGEHGNDEIKRMAHVMHRKYKNKIKRIGI